MFAKRLHCSGGVLHALEPVTVCDQFRHFGLVQREHEFRREAPDVAFHGLVQRLCLNAVEFREIAVQHHLNATKRQNTGCDGW